MKFVWVLCQLLGSSPVRSQSSWFMKLLGRVFMSTEFLMEALSLDAEGEFRDSLSLHFLFYKSLKLKIMNILK